MYNNEFEEEFEKLKQENERLKTYLKSAIGLLHMKDSAMISIMIEKFIIDVREELEG